MRKLSFEWDENKARSNLQKHGVSFDEAKTVFIDENALFMDDPDEVDDEDRFLLLGASATLNLLVVCHCYRESAGVIRIVSARKADRKERNLYLERCSE